MNFSESRYDTMPFRKCGRWGLKLPAISLGAWETFGGYRGEDTARECLFRAFDLGITHIDLANNYGRPAGNAEQIVGRILKDMPRDELIVSTKAGYHMWEGPYGEWGSRKYILASLDQSLKRLDLPYVDIFYSHRFDPETPLEETIGALNTAVQSGRALYAGISNYPGAKAREACAIARDHDWAPIVIHQPAYNMLHRGIEPDLLPVAREEGFGIIAFSPLASGVLSAKYLGGATPKGSRATTPMGEGVKRRLEDPSVLPRLEKLNQIALRRGQTLAQMALIWVLRNPEVTSALIGASSPGQIEENIAALSAPALTTQEIDDIETVLAS
jgi:L-glyceraldehyde 3-phosphate reductase